jgi:hypothetical protein
MVLMESWRRDIFSLVLGLLAFLFHASASSMPE